MAQIPLSLVLALVAIGVGEWPGVDVWSDINVIHHALVHGLFGLAGAMIGYQTAWWTRKVDQSSYAALEDREVIS